MTIPSTKKLLEIKLGRKLTKKEFEIEQQKLFDEWNKNIGDLEDDEPLTPEERLCMLDEDDFHRLFN